MAITTLDKTLLKLNEPKELEATAEAAVFGIDAKGGDYKMLFIFSNAGEASATATIAVGNGIQGVGDDLVVTVPAGEMHGIVLDSGYFKNVSGEYKDYVKVTPSASLNVAAVELPQ
jgi:hypothetical protein